MQTDDIDTRLLSLLRENARAPTVELARRLGLSRTTVQSRLDRLERAKVIVGYTVRVGDAAERDSVRAHVMITVGPKLAPAVEAALRRVPEVRTLHTVNGIYDMIAIIVAPSVSALDRLIDHIGGLDGVERTTSTIVLSTRLDR
jgi:DNA-binding Lrp family transcriptional regulator